MYLFFDTETTGLPLNYKAPLTNLSNWPRLVQLAYIYCDKEGKVMDSGDYIIKPEGFIIPPDVSKIHGITHDRAINEGDSLSTIMATFELIISRCTYLVAHNMAFDEKIVGAEFLRNGIPDKTSTKPKICTMQLTTNYCKLPGKFGYKWPKLSELHIKLFGVDFQEAHNAAVDIQATVKCFFRLKELGIITK